MAFQSATEINTSLYNQDFNLWLETTSQLLKQRQFNALDIENLVEEIEGMGKSQKNALKSNLRVVLMHLLKYKYQPEKRSNSWLYSIFEHRTRLQDTLEDSPSLKPYLQQVFGKCYQDARKEASLETGLPLSLFPDKSPFTDEETLDSDYLPDCDEI
jgi:hypothetical protein